MFLQVNRIHFYVLKYLIQFSKKNLEVYELVHMVSKHHTELANLGIYTSQQDVYVAIEYLIKHEAIWFGDFDYPVLSSLVGDYTITKRFVKCNFKTLWAYHGMQYFCLN
jgi:hypothetical protein